MQKKPFLKQIESFFKRFLKRFLLFFLPKQKNRVPKPDEIKRVLLFRLDQRVGNGLLLLPLLNALHQNRYQLEAHLLIHAPVAELFKNCQDFPAARVWSYDQPKLMKKPWQYLTLLRELRQQQFDIAFSSNNPDNFSLSQAIFGRLTRSKYLIGFDARDSAVFYDLAVSSGTDRHYAEAMVDLWRAIDPAAKTKFAGLKMPDQHKIEAVKHYPQYASGGILVWLGATGQKILPAEIWKLLYDSLQESEKPIHFAAGPADNAHVQKYPSWLREKTTCWQTPLMESAALLTRFDAFISADTGPMHLAAALGCATFSIFLNPNIIQYGYQDSDRSLALRWDGKDGESQKIVILVRRFLKANGWNEPHRLTKAKEQGNLE